MSTPFGDLGRILEIIPTYNEAENIEPIVIEAMARVGRWGLAYRGRQLRGLVSRRKG